MIDFSTLQGLTIPEGVVTQIEGEGVVLWKIANEPAYAAVYGGNTLVFGRGKSAPSTYNSLELTEGAEWSSATGYDIETLAATSTSQIPWYSSYCTAITSVLVVDTIAPVDTSYWFYDMTNCTSMDLNLLDGSSATSMSFMFTNCSYLTSLALPQGFGSQVTTGNMSYMFYGCSALESLALPQGFGSQVTTGDMFFMFCGCSYLTSLTLPEGFGSNVTTSDMHGMFGSCSSLETLVLPDGFGSNATECDIDNMFANCSSLTSLDISDLNTKNAIDIFNMFEGLDALEQITLGENFSFKVEGAIECELPTQGFDGADGKWYFENGESYTPSELAEQYDGSTMAGTYSAIEPSTYAVYSADNTTLYFVSCTKIPTSVDIDGNTVTTYWSELTTADPASSPFASCASLCTAVEFKDHIKPSITAMWFTGFGKLETVKGLDKLDTSSVTNMDYMFTSCSALTTLDLSALDTSSVVSMQYMFYGCTSLASLDISSFNTSNVTHMNFMFTKCSSLTSLDLSSFDTSNVSTMKNMFQGCSALETIYASDLWSTDAVSNGSYMFSGCTKLSGDVAVADIQVYDSAYAKTSGGYLTYKAAS